LVSIAGACNPFVGAGAIVGVFINRGFRDVVARVFPNAVPANACQASIPPSIRLRKAYGATRLRKRNATPPPVSGKTMSRPPNL